MVFFIMLEKIFGLDECVLHKKRAGFNAFLDYTKKLSELQIQEEQDHFIREANNVWKPSSCLVDLIGET